MIHEYAAKRQKYKDSKPITCMAKKKDGNAVLF